MLLPKMEESKLRESLKMRIPKNMHQLIRSIEEHKRLKDDGQQSKGKAPVTLQFNRDPRSGGF